MCKNYSKQAEKAKELAKGMEEWWNSSSIISLKDTATYSHTLLPFFQSDSDLIQPVFMLHFTGLKTEVNGLEHMEQEAEGNAPFYLLNWD